MGKNRPRAAFVVTVSILGAAACHKDTAGGGRSGGGECLPPDCHMNPPPPPPPPPIAQDAGGATTDAQASSAPLRPAPPGAAVFVEGERCFIREHPPCADCTEPPPLAKVEVACPADAGGGARTKRR